MENKYMRAQCQNMLSIMTAFSQACELAAREDDGILSKTEEHELKKIRIAAQQFQKELTQIMR